MSRKTVESSRKLDLTRLKQLGFLQKDGGYKSENIQWSTNGENTGEIQLIMNTVDVQYIRLKYKIKNHWESEEKYRDYDYQFSLEKVPCHFGGFRWFVRCGLMKNDLFCGRRCRVLYSVGDYFGCRHCANLTYESCNLSGRYKGFLSIPDIDEQEAKVKRMFYGGKPTRKYLKLLKMEERFEASFVRLAERYRK